MREVAGEPVGAVLGGRDDEQLVGREDGERVGDGVQRVGVADPAGRAHAGGLERGEPRVEPAGGGGPRGILVRAPVAQARVQGRRDHGDLDGAGLRDERVVHGGRLERLERDGEDMTAGGGQAHGEAPSIASPTRSRPPLGAG